MLLVTVHVTELRICAVSDHFFFYIAFEAVVNHPTTKILDSHKVPFAQKVHASVWSYSPVLPRQICLRICSGFDRFGAHETFFRQLCFQIVKA